AAKPVADPLTADGRCPTCGRLLSTWTEARRDQHLARCAKKSNNESSNRRQSKRLIDSSDNRQRPEPSLKSLLRRAADEDLQTALALSRSVEAARKVAAKEAEETRRAVASVPSVFRLTPEARRERLLAAVAEILRPASDAPAQIASGTVRSDLWRLTSIEMQPRLRYLVPDLLELLPGVVCMAAEDDSLKTESVAAVPVDTVESVDKPTPSTEESPVKLANQSQTVAVTATSETAPTIDKVLSDFQSMVGNELCADLHFLIESSDGCIIPAHRFVFAARCPLSCLQRLDRSTDAEGRIPLTGISKDDLISSLNFLYSGGEEPLSDAAKQLLSSWRSDSPIVDATIISKKRRSESINDDEDADVALSNSEKRRKLENSLIMEETYGWFPVSNADDVVNDNVSSQPVIKEVPTAVDDAQIEPTIKSDANNSSCCDLFAASDDDEDYENQQQNSDGIDDCVAEEQVDCGSSFNNLSAISVPACDHLCEASFFDQPPTPAPPVSDPLIPASLTPEQKKSDSLTFTSAPLATDPSTPPLTTAPLTTDPVSPNHRHPFL
ncbi:hypothetical protein BOX15_Mlig016585g3, partial [Macrostomum lignano]